jgi:hypothetical protein
MSLSTTRACLLFLTIVALLSSCAQILPPTGGAKDISPPKLLEITPQDSLLHTRVNKVSLRFDEFVGLNNAASEVTISPILPFPLDVSVAKKTVTVKIPDSLLQANTTYRISFGKAIQDIHENNPFTGYTYTFSTGDYFDSLQLNGSVTDAATGLKDTGALIILYDAAKSDSAVVREKPLYAARTDASGNFQFSGLPERSFKIFALKDANDNMIYDGSDEMIAFLDSVVVPSNGTRPPIQLFLFKAADTSTATTVMEKGGKRGKPAMNQPAPGQGFSYSVGVDTNDSKRRTFDVTSPLEITFTEPFTSFNDNRLSLVYDSAGIDVEADITRVIDTSRQKTLLLRTDWQENALYTLRLLKGFVKDTAGNDAMPSRYTFRTKRDEDYGKLQVHLPEKYSGDQYIFVLLKGDDTVYHRPVADTIIRFNHLNPGTYTLRVIIDANRNGKWDSGDLLKRKQPERVIPYNNEINLRPGWENMIDFEEKPKVTDRK